MADEPKTKSDQTKASNADAKSKQKDELEAMFAKVEGSDKLTSGMLKNLLEKARAVKMDGRLDVDDIMSQLQNTSGVMGPAGVSKFLKDIMKFTPGTPPMRRRKFGEKKYEDRIMRIAKENSKKDGGKVKRSKPKPKPKKAGRLALRGYGIARK